MRFSCDARCVTWFPVPRVDLQRVSHRPVPVISLPTSNVGHSDIKDPRYFWTRVPRFGNCGRTFTLQRNDTFCRNHICSRPVGRVRAWICRSRICFFSAAPSGETTTCILLMETAGARLRNQRGPAPQTATQGRGQQRKSVEGGPPSPCGLRRLSTHFIVPCGGNRLRRPQSKEGDSGWREITGKIYWATFSPVFCWTVIRSSVGMGEMPSSTLPAIASL